MPPGADVASTVPSGASRSIRARVPPTIRRVASENAMGSTASARSGKITVSPVATSATRCSWEASASRASCTLAIQKQPTKPAATIAQKPANTCHTNRERAMKKLRESCEGLRTTGTDWEGLSTETRATPGTGIPRHGRFRCRTRTRRVSCAGRRLARPQTAPSQDNPPP